jgi:RNA polymerase sigma-70 factor (ECF subfamily)
LDDALMQAKPDGIDTLALNEALDSLSKIDPRKGRVVELRYFGGLSLEETAEALDISPETVKRDWRMAKAWLFGALTQKRA